ncbi:cobalamin B12-binding domain-containing protein [Nonomuraea gerenzanensis]|uniref:5-methyltetrahydrofolate--homocysteine methyltransferase n=1 Tax=Nonomuraea gerenzanensis TaxID=93944 RepID=A0A1M4EH40_9ACTN|nr:cobalamin-dependent protein [Nonomuraea gerenzanensis]UBU09642.1 cobalamin-dependent protein [Nonomuraea gerenzanensis]SBO98074.1 5-methyltetrahydrofolate--homocysteine methyltransferase [Nonomuraea gerenzanensis]
MADNLETLTGKIWTSALDGDDHGAADAALAALGDGLPVEDLLLNVVAPIQRQVGDAWAANEVTVAQEHIVTAVSERVLAAAARHPAARARHVGVKGRAAVACVDGEWHAFPARLLAEVLRLDGWRVDYLGPHVPTPFLPIHVREAEVDVVLLSASLPTRLPAAHEAIAACRETGRPVLAGGAAFGGDGRYARLLGADGWAPDARATAERLTAGPAPGETAYEGSNGGTGPAGQEHGHPTTPTGQEHGHPATAPDREYGHLTETAQELIDTVMWRLGERIPAMAAYDNRQLKHTREDIGHLIDFLAISLYVDDPTLYSRFLLWMAGILTARNVPEDTLFPALDLIATGLKGCPRARATVEHGQEALRREHGKDRPGHPF